jgi:glycosyltransferase involved in cell wall biosynthesis
MYNLHFSRALAALGHRVTVLSSRHSADVPALEETKGVRVHRILTRPSKHRLRRIPLIGRHIRDLQNLIYSARVCARLRRILKDDPADAVEFAEVEGEGFVFLALPHSQRTVVRCHTPLFLLRRYQELPFSTALTAAMERFSIRHADLLTAPSRSMAEVISRECGIEAARVHVFPNPVPAAEGEPRPRGRSSDGVRVLYVGRLEHGKGVSVLAAALPLVLKEVPNARLVLAGPDRPGPGSRSWMQLLREDFSEKGISDRVRFLGTLPPEDVDRSYSDADLVVVPSVQYESFSYTCAQAMAAGLPVVASRIGAIPETLEDGACGILVEPGDPRALAEAIIRLAADADLRRSLGDSGRARVAERFAPPAVARRFLELL